MKRLIATAIIAMCLTGCNPAGNTIKMAAGQSTFASFNAQGDVIIQGDGTADFEVEVSGNDTEWLLKLKTVTVREAIGGAASIAADNNVTVRAGLATLNNLAAIAAPIIAVRMLDGEGEPDTVVPSSDPN